MEICYKKLSYFAKAPVRASDYAAGYDLFVERIEPNNAAKDGSVRIKKGETVKVHTGIAMSIPKGYFGAIFARSGLAVKSGLRPANCVGVIDSDYRGEIIVALHNDSGKTQFVRYGDRVAQIVILPCVDIEFNEVKSLDETMRGEGGFGSTGSGAKEEEYQMTICDICRDNAINGGGGCTASCIETQKTLK